MNRWIGMMWVMLAGTARGQADRYDVLISEVMADPSPVVGMPVAEYIELKNVSGKAIDLVKWKISNGSSTAVINTSFILQPDSLVVICPRTQVALFDTSLKVHGITNFPGLINEAGTISLHTADGKTIHAMAYRSGLHENTIKADGGWSLEMVDYRQPCRPDNWQSSRHPKGGTPGRANSQPATPLPANRFEAVQCLATSSSSLLLQLNQGGDSLSLSNPLRYTLYPRHTQITAAQPVPPLFREIRLTLQSPLRDTGLYTVYGNDLRYCREMNQDSIRVLTGLSALPAKGDLLINELLFNPAPDGSDYLEIVNTSRKVINSREILLATQNSGGSITSAFPAGSNERNIFPGDHLVFTTDTAYLLKRWHPVNKRLVVRLDAMPSLPDEKGNISLLSRQGEVLDAFNYTDALHFPLLASHEGVALERIDPGSSGTAASNWHSAASSSGYGTPTKQNSQYKASLIPEGLFIISPAIISPDNDGQDDILSIHYQFSEPGILLSAVLFNHQGIQLGKLVNNQLCGNSGSFHWNGRIGNQPIKKGTYILLIESLSLQGRIEKTKRMIGVQ